MGKDSLKRKQICVPKSRAALYRLDYNNVEEGDLVELLLDDDIFFELERINFFQAINNLAHSNIDNFEDDAIIEECYLNNVLNSDIFCDNRYEVEIFKIAKQIEELFLAALKYKTGVFFYF